MLLKDCDSRATDKCGSILTDRRGAEEVVFPQKVREERVDLMSIAQQGER